MKWNFPREWFAGNGNWHWTRPVAFVFHLFFILVGIHCALFVRLFARDFLNFVHSCYNYLHVENIHLKRYALVYFPFFWPHCLFLNRWCRCSFCMLIFSHFMCIFPWYTEWIFQHSSHSVQCDAFFPPASNLLFFWHDVLSFSPLKCFCFARHTQTQLHTAAKSHGNVQASWIKSHDYEA